MPAEPLDPSAIPQLSGAERLTATEALRLLGEHDVRFLSLQFVDILGVAKSIDVPASQFEKTLDRGHTFDGSGIEGFARVEESDLVLRPDIGTLRILPWGGPLQRTARVLCDIWRSSGTAFDGDPRAALRRAIEGVRSGGLEAAIGTEVEFYLFDGGGGDQRAERAGYLDPLPESREEVARREIVALLEALGFEVESSHHDRGAGQHGIDFHYSDPLTAADNLTTLKTVVRVVARRHGLRASFMPKPRTGEPGCGLHTHQSLTRDGRNIFHDPDGKDGLSDALRSYVAGLLRHARGFCAVTNPLVNSYKRLVPGYAAPAQVTWSFQNRSPMVRIPPEREGGTRCELRLPDPAANPYLAIAVQLAAGIAGLSEELTPPEPVNSNVWTMSSRERQRLKIEELPRNLGEALDTLAHDRVVRAALGEHIFSHFTQAKRAEFESYLAQVHAWEHERYGDL
jgi:glutamine synthetase